MANQKQPARWESSMLAAAMAVAGTLFVFDKLGSLMHTGLASFHSIAHAAPIFLVALGMSLMLADQNGRTENPGAGVRKEGHYE